MKQCSEKGVEVDLCLIGRKAEAFFKRVGGHVLGSAEHLGDTPQVKDIVGVITIMLTAFDNSIIEIAGVGVRPR